MTRINISAQLRQFIFARANHQCEYCLSPEKNSSIRHTIDHIRAVKHEGATEVDNLALACIVCNRNKGSDIATFDPETQQLVRLFNPRQDIWADHFKLDGARIEGLTPIGRGTVHLMQFNHATRVRHRALLQEEGHYLLS